MNENNIRPSIASGKFYSSSKDVLEKEINALLHNNKSKADKKIFALMVPHAGYQYAEKVMAAAYAKLNNSKIKTVIIIGNSHHSYFDNISIYAEGAFMTPLGEVEIDNQITQKLMKKNKKIISDFKSHTLEHSIEVLLPFLQITLKIFKIVPIIMGNDLMPTCKMLANSLKEIIEGRDDILLIASSDMSHYPPYESAMAADKEVLGTIKKGDAQKLENLLADLELRGIPSAVSFLCGAGAVKTIMLLAKELGATNIDIVKYANSGDATGETAGVVGYGAVSFSFSH